MSHQSPDQAKVKTVPQRKKTAAKTSNVSAVKNRRTAQKDAPLSEPVAQRRTTKRRLLRLADVFVVVAVIGLCSFGIYNRMTAASQLPPCTTQGTQYELSLRSDSFDKPELSLMRCDTILFMNNDTQPYMLAVGVHDKHIDYPGFKSALLRPGEGIMFDAVESGTFQIHDHLRDNAKIQLLIKVPRE